MVYMGTVLSCFLSSLTGQSNYSCLNFFPLTSFFVNTTASKGEWGVKKEEEEEKKKGTEEKLLTKCYATAVVMNMEWLGLYKVNYCKKRTGFCRSVTL